MHISEVQKCGITLEEGTVVTFEKQVGNNGKQSACNLALAE